MDTGRFNQRAHISELESPLVGFRRLFSVGRMGLSWYRYAIGFGFRFRFRFCSLRPNRSELVVWEPTRTHVGWHGNARQLSCPSEIETRKRIKPDQHARKLQPTDGQVERATCYDLVQDPSGRV